ATLFEKHRTKILATGKLLAAMHDESLKLSQDNVGYGLIAGWSESDACLAPDPSVWWKPYFANSAVTARGLKDFAGSWLATSRAKSDATLRNAIDDWFKRSITLQR